jgi:hypothetical protein
VKEQYFGDVNDYRKYGLLRCIVSSTRLRLLVAWMRTCADGRTDGNRLAYLQRGDKWSQYDHVLFERLRCWASSGTRSVSQIEESDTLPNAEYYSARVSDCAAERDLWFEKLSERAKRCDIVFLDPDNGLEVESRRYGRKDSSKYVYLPEIKRLWNQGKSLLVYQHFAREPRSEFIRHKTSALEGCTNGSVVDVFSAKHVIFLMVLQQRDLSYRAAIVRDVNSRWAGQIDHVGNVT